MVTDFRNFLGRVLFHSVCLGTGLFCIGCGTFGSGNGPDDPGDEAQGAGTGSRVTTVPGKDQIEVGKVAYVSPFGFVLIKSIYGDRISAGTEILGRSANGAETCTLRCSPEKKPAFIVADILSGAPERGHVAYASKKSLSASPAQDVDVPGSGRVPVAPGSESNGPTDDLPPLPDFPVDDLAPGDLPELELD